MRELQIDTYRPVVVTESICLVTSLPSKIVSFVVKIPYSLFSKNVKTNPRNTDKHTVRPRFNSVQ
jgi:hypothetical protein